MTRITGNLHGEQYTFLIISRWILLRMRSVSDKSCREDQIMWKNIVEPDRPQMKIGRLRIVCWTPKATNAHSEYVILIAFPLQQW